MNKTLTTLGTALLFSVTSFAYGSSSTDLTVTGVITPAACTPSLSGGGVVDYGKISSKDLNPDTHTQFQDRTVQLTVSCDAPVKFAIVPVDNRAGTSSTAGAFGLGLINGNEKLGRYFLHYVNPVANVPSLAIQSQDNGQTWFEPDDSALKPDDLLSFGSSNAGVTAPHDVQDVIVDILLLTAIAPTNGLTLTDEQKIDGSATLQITYL
ncbi:Protein GltF [Pseudomonas fluorescens]|uniref:Protein GltF n=1 Tax=Pseudomonas fluorescens TaxID=294 RepID=A0A5E7SZX3_PSEFL|nr:DUF1120 domain-containing protein [Pseudomonas fluorescens]VVP91594.1 Protein GltF [Pseudomonas fluorescens]